MIDVDKNKPNFTWREFYESNQFTFSDSYFLRFLDSVEHTGFYSGYERHFAWVVYVELSTRVATVRLGDGREKAALESIVSLFRTIRTEAANNGPYTAPVSVWVLSILNSEVRRFTGRWHPQTEFLDQSNTSPEAKQARTLFRGHLRDLQDVLQKVAQVLFSIATGPFRDDY